MNPSLSSATYERLLSSIVDVICSIDAYGIFQYVSPASKRLFGYHPEEMIGASFLNFILPEDVAKTIQIVSDKSPECVTSNFENRYYHKDGTIIPILWSGRWDHESQLLYCVARNGTEKKEADMRLGKAQQMARIASIEYSTTSEDYSYVSDSFYAISGVDQTLYPSITPSLFWSLIHPEDKNIVEGFYHPNQSDTASYEYRMIRPDGHVIYIHHQQETLCDTDGKIIKIIGTIQDITDRKLTELAIQQSEQRFKFLVHNGSDLIGIIDALGNYTYVADSVNHLLGYDIDFFKGKNAFEFIHPEDQPQTLKGLEEASKQLYTAIKPFRFKNKNGEWRWVETNVANYLNNPAINGYIVNSRDITERKKAEADLALSEQKFKSVVHNGSDMIVVVDEEGTFKYISENVNSILGFNPSYFEGKNAFDFIHQEDVPTVLMELQRVLNHDDEAKGVQHRFLKSNGEWLWFESKGMNQLDNPSVAGLIINARDITERISLQKKLDEELINKQKEITTAVIKAQENERSQIGLELHDNVNQVLTTIKLYNELCLSGYEQNKELLNKSTVYLQDCINEIRSISKRLSAPTLGNINLEDSIRELVESINLTNRLEIRYLPENVENVSFHKDIHLAVYRIIQEGLNNIIKYADAKTAIIEIRNHRHKLCISIKDDGIGFDSIQKRKGIGITNMKTRAENLNGRFTLKSSPGKGCHIEICLPLID